jgi:outer membrane lipoprotein-sorting protein
MRQRTKARIFILVAAALLFALAGSGGAVGQQLDPASVIQRVDAAVKARVDSIAGYTVTEHYAVYRNNDETHPVAEMTVKTTYREDSGKSYTILSQSGSALIRGVVLGSILNNEKSLNQPGIRAETWITSANYQMQLEPDGSQALNGRECLVLALTPRRKTPYLLQGKLWVDARDGSIMQIEGTASKSASFMTGPTQIVRQYADISGFPEATHARAVSNSFMFGETVVTIDYQNYQVQMRPPA